MWLVKVCAMLLGTQTLDLKDVIEAMDAAIFPLPNPSYTLKCYCIIS